jgi:hypothetical protein
LTGARAGIANLPSEAFGVGGFTDGVAGAAAAGTGCGFPKSDGGAAGGVAGGEGAGEGLLNNENGEPVAGGCDCDGAGWA